MFLALFCAMKNLLELNFQGPSWYQPAIWPLGNIASAMLKPKDEKPAPPKAVSWMLFNPYDMVIALSAGLRSFGLAYATIYFLHDEKNPYPAFGGANELRMEWMWPIILRNTIATLVICGFWDWFLYFSPMQVTSTLESVTTKNRSAYGKLQIKLRFRKNFTSTKLQSSILLCIK